MSKAVCANQRRVVGFRPTSLAITSEYVLQSIVLHDPPPLIEGGLNAEHQNSIDPRKFNPLTDNNLMIPTCHRLAESTA